MEEDKEPQLQLQSHEKDCRDSRVRVRLKDSLLSQLTQLDPSLSPSTVNSQRHSDFIHRRLQEIFPSLDTPTHPPYALMIRRAIAELNEGGGSTEEAISEFVRREYKDLPWAHRSILGLHLKKLCQDGEIECTKGGRYVILVDGDGGGGEEAERGNGSGKKREMGKRRRTEGDEIERGARVEDAGTEEPSEGLELTQEQGELAHNHSIRRVEERAESEDGQLEVDGQHLEVQVSAPNELEESQIQDIIPHLEKVYSSPQTALNLTVDSQQLSPIPILEELPNCIPAGSELSLTQGQAQISCHGPSQSSLDAEANMSASLCPLVPQEDKQDENPMDGDVDLLHTDDQCTQGPGIGLERHSTLHRIAHHINEQQDLAVNDPNFPVNLTHKFGQPLEVTTSEGSQKCIIPGIESSSLEQLQLQKSSDIDLGIVSKTEASLTWVNSDDDKQPHHFNHGSPQANPDENPPKRRRGRPRKSETIANYPRGLFPSDDDIHNKQESNIKITGRGKENQGNELLPLEDQVQLVGQGRGRGRPRGSGSGSGSGKGRGRGQGRGRGRGRGGGRSSKLDQNTNQCEEQGPVSSPNLEMIPEPPASKATSM